jgi:PAS domain S-box-containing protein
MQNLAELFESADRALLAQWAIAVEAGVVPGERSTGELSEHMPSLLHALATEGGHRVHASGGAAQLREGFELASVVREYRLLLDTALDFAERATTPLPTREVRMLANRIGSALHNATAEHGRRQAVASRANAAHDALRAVELFEHAPAIIGQVTGPDHVFTFANAWFRQLVGGRRLVGLRLLEAIPELGSQRVATLLDRVFASGAPFVARAMPASLDRTGAGEVREGLFDFVYQPTRDATGQVDGVFIHAVEVTEHADRAQRLADIDESLRAAEEQRNELSFLLRQAPVAITLFSGSKHVIELANPGVCRLWGRTEAQVVGKPLFEALPEAAGQGFEALLAEVRATGVPFVGKELLARLSRSEGGALEDVYMDFVYQPLFNLHGAVDNILVVANEVTERVRAREALEAARVAAESQRAKLNEIFMQAPAMVAVLRGPSHVFELVNPAYTAAIGGREVRGLPILEALPELVGQGFVELLDGVYATGEPVVGNEVMVHLDRLGVGTTEAAYFDFVYRALNDQDVDTLDGILVFGVDVTEQVLARREIEGIAQERKTLLDDARAARALAEHASRSMDEFLATVSHELRTPLTAILGWARLLRADEVPEATRAKAIATIERNAVVQAQLIEDLLDVSRIISGKMRLEIGPLDLRSVIEAALDVVRPAADAKGVQLAALFDGHVPDVTGDGSRLQQVAWNLLSNAVKFTPRGGRVEIRLSPADAFVEITVTDTGQGMAAPFVAHAFERFRQADGATTRSHGGLGLGLAIVKNIVELHGGSVRASSAGLGEGSSFVVQLPLGVAHPPSAARPPSERPSSRSAAPASGSGMDGLRILVVEDEDDARELLVTILERAGAIVSAASSAREALAVLERERPTVILSDIGMPGEDGHALVRQIRALGSESIARTPAVALTAFARPEDRTRALDAGFDSYVSKPVEPRDLFAAITSAAALRSTARH